jgi:hypothetical protein
MTESTVIDLGSLCVYCRKDTAFGHPDQVFVNRITKSFIFHEMEIKNPFLSECGRFTVDPITYYGLTITDLANLWQANVQPPFCNECDNKGYVENPDDDGYFIRCESCNRYTTDAEAEQSEEEDRTNFGGRG